MAAADDSLGYCGLVQGLCGLVQVFLVPRSGGVLARKYGRTGSQPRDLEIRSDTPLARVLRFDGQEEEEDLPPVAPAVGGDLSLCSSSSRGSALGVVEVRSDEQDLSPVVRSSTVQRNGMASGVVDDDDDDDDCVILDSDPHSAVTVNGGKEGSAGDGSSDEELQIVAEKGQVACRDFPHSRHLCSNMPFDTTSHEKHCSMCYCFVCDAPAPCSYWDKGISVYKHCHATDKETIWKTLRQAFRLRSNGSGTSNGHTAQISHPLPLTVSAPRAHPAAGAGRGTSNAHTAQISHPQALAVSATRVQSGIGNGHSTQVTHLVEPSVSAPRAYPAPGAGRGTSNGNSAQVPHALGLTARAPRAHPAAGAGRHTSNAQASHSLALTVSGPGAFSATRVQSGTRNGHSAQVTHLVEPTVSAPRPHPAEGGGRGTSNAHTALITHPVEPTVSGARPYSAARTGTTVTSNVHNSQITHPVDPTISGRRAYPAGSTGRGISNAHTAQITRPVEQTISAPRVYPGARTGRGSSNARSAQNTYPAMTNGEPDAPEGATVYVGNLPYHIDNERLKLSFQDAGVVLFSKVIYDRETGQSRGFGYVTMNTVQEAEVAVRMYQGSMVYGRPLTVKIAPPRGGGRVDTARRQSDSTLKIFVCNLPTQVDHSRLEQLFSKHGKVVDARVIYESRGDTCCSRGFGFVTMASEEESHNAIHALNKQVLEGHALRVKVARDMRPQRGGLSLSNQNPLENAVSGIQNAHTSVRGSPSVAPSVSAAGAGSSTSNAHTAQVTN